MDYANKTRLLGKRPSLSDDTKTALAVILLFAVYALVGTLEYSDEVSYQAEIRPVCER